jgi:N-methylhydantoinase A
LTRAPERPSAEDFEAESTAEAVEERDAFFETLGDLVPTPVYAGSSLVAGDVIRGPAIVQEETTTILVNPDDRLLVRSDLNYVIEIGR